MQLPKDPRRLNLEKTPVQLKINKAGIWSAVMRTVFDSVMGQLGQATAPEWRKALELREGKERQAFQLIATSLIETSRRQLKDRISQTDLDENKRLTHDTRHLRFEIFEGLKNNNYIFHSNDLTKPEQIGLLSDFLPFYKDWLKESFDLDDTRAEDFAMTFRDRFTHVFLSMLTDNSNNYADLIAWCNSPQLKVLAENTKRINYRAELREYYHRPALGEIDVMLSDIYTCLNFKVYKGQLLSKKTVAKIEPILDNPEDIFQETKHDGSVHDWFLNHFLKQAPTPAFILQQADSRLLLLLGQPGHGKSSFCYRGLYDLLSDSEFFGETFFVKLNEADKDLLNEPLVEISQMLPYKPNFELLFDAGQTRPVVLFMDGLDEMYMTQSLSDNDVLQLLDKCYRLTKQHNNLFFVFTSRFNYVETISLAGTGAIVFALDNLTVVQQEYMIDVYKEQKNLSDCNLEKDFLEEVRKKEELEHIRELIELPILLQMILISGITLDEDSSRAKIYDELFTTVLNRKWSKDKRLKKARDNNTFKPQHLRSYLAYLAYEIFRSKNNYLHRHEIESFPRTESFKRRFLNKAYENAKMKDVLKDILTSFYLKEARPDEGDQKGRGQNAEYAVEFLHKSLYEYLACEHIWERLTKFFLKEEEDYQDYTFLKVITEIQDIFALFRFTEETAAYLVEILNEAPEEHELLQERMAYYLPRLVKHGFLHSYQMPMDNSLPIYTAEQQALHSFYGYWLVLSNLRQEEIRDKYGNEKRETSIKEMQFVNKKLDLCIEDFGTFLRKLSADLLIFGFNFSYFSMGKIDLKLTILINNEFYHSDFSSAFFVSSLLRRTNFRYANLQQTNFRYANLVNANLTETELNAADLTDANLEAANLSYANLYFASLSNANLSFAGLISTELSDAELNGVNFYYAELNGANLSNANLSNANLESANLSNTKLNHANFSGANLKEIHLDGAVISDEGWISDLKEMEIIGAEEIEEKYFIEEFTDEGTNETLYRLCLKEKPDD